MCNLTRRELSPCRHADPVDPVDPAAVAVAVAAVAVKVASETLDYCLIAIALWVFARTQTVESMALLAFFAGSTAIVEFLTLINYFDQLGATWFIIYQAWIAIFILISRTRRVIILYALQQILCFCVIFTWNPDDSAVYNAYSYAVAIIYLMQLGCVYGSSNIGGASERDGTGLHLAHLEPRK